MEKKYWFILAIGCVLLSIASLFMSVITYYTPQGFYYSFNIIDMIVITPEFNRYILNDYVGRVILDINGVWVTALAVIFILSIVCAVIGILTLRIQRPNKWQFRLTVAGLIGVTIPSLLIIVCVLGFGRYFVGRISFGIAPILTPIAMIICIITVVRRKTE